MCAICRAAAIQGEEQLYKFADFASVMLRSALRRKSIKKLTLTSTGGRHHLNCHDSLISTAFPTRSIPDMDFKQLSLLLLSQRFNISYDSHPVIMLLH